MWQNFVDDIMDISYGIMTFTLKDLYFKKARVAIFADMRKL